jgi:hypothetical protein
MSRHRREVRPRYGRIAVLAASVTVSAVAALAGSGVLATGSAQAGADTKPASYTPATQATGQPSGAGSETRLGSGEDQTGQTSSTDDRAQPGASEATTPSDAGSPGAGPPDASSPDAGSPKALPAESGSGRRIVFDQSDQRVWLVGSEDAVQRTYPVSGSVLHNLQPGTYSVYSKSRWAVGIDDSGVMQYFVRFTQGPTGAAIGFHSIPTKNGVPLQTRAQLGTPQSHGCIRQYLPNAIALWNFAPIGTKVVVVA